MCRQHLPLLIPADTPHLAMPACHEDNPNHKDSTDITTSKRSMADVAAAQKRTSRRWHCTRPNIMKFVISVLNFLPTLHPLCRPSPPTSPLPGACHQHCTTRGLLALTFNPPTSHTCTTTWPVAAYLVMDWVLPSLVGGFFACFRRGHVSVKDLRALLEPQRKGQ